MPRIFVNPKSLVVARINSPKGVPSVEESLKNLSKADPTNISELQSLIKNLSRAITASQKVLDLRAQGFEETKPLEKPTKAPKATKTAKATITK